MKQLWIILLLILSIYSCDSTWEKEYKSKERDAYYSINDTVSAFYSIETDSLNIVNRFLGYQNPFFELSEMVEYTPYNDSLEIYKGVWDTLLRHESRGDVRAALYWGYPSIKVAYSADGGTSWGYYETGIKNNEPLHIKKYAEHPLINDQGNLEVEVCLFRQTSYRPMLGENFWTVVKDGLLLTIDIETLRKDSDNDGLTDIEETLLRTNLNNPDTDGDGIPDNLDMNPRMNPPRTERTIVYEAVINGDNRVRFIGEGAKVIPFSETPETSYYSQNMPTFMVVTDIPDLQSVQPIKERVVFLTSEEYEKTRNPFCDEFLKEDFSPLFKVDHHKNKFVFSASGGFWYTDYVVKKKSQGWLIQAYSSIIE